MTTTIHHIADRAVSTLDRLDAAAADRHAKLIAGRQGLPRRRQRRLRAFDGCPRRQKPVAGTGWHWHRTGGRVMDIRRLFLTAIAARIQTLRERRWPIQMPFPRRIRGTVKHSTPRSQARLERRLGLISARGTDPVLHRHWQYDESCPCCKDTGYKWAATPNGGADRVPCHCPAGFDFAAPPAQVADRTETAVLP